MSLKLNVKKIVLLLIISLIIGTSLYSLITRKLFNDLLPMPFNLGSAVVISGSMEPTLSVDDLIIVKKSNEYKEKEIIVYQKENNLIVHRIIKIDKNTVITKGDANNLEDHEISKEAIKGKVILIVPYFGMLTNYVRSPLGVISIFLITIIIYHSINKNEKKLMLEEINKLQEEIDYLK